jgi:hypothetical protein
MVLRKGLRGTTGGQAGLLSGDKCQREDDFGPWFRSRSQNQPQSPALGCLLSPGADMLRKKVRSRSQNQPQSPALGCLLSQGADMLRKKVFLG